MPSKCRSSGIIASFVLLVALLLLSSDPAFARRVAGKKSAPKPKAQAVEATSEETGAKSELSCCQRRKQDASVIWIGNNPRMTFKQLASYAGPILAFSSDEPLLDGKSGDAIRIPEAFPFQNTPDAPVAYYRVTSILTDADNGADAYIPDESFINDSILNLDEITAIDLDFFFYYTSEEGVGHHPHDLESVEFKLEILRNRESDCNNCRYAIRVERIIAKAHGIVWYDNTLDLEDIEEVSLPITIFVEEGKHASCTDRNADLFYSPGYDVNRRMTDAWGVRDVIRSGTLATSSYQSWMTKPRSAAYLVVPPLPENSPLYPHFVLDRRQLQTKAVYQLRPFPSATLAADDKLLHQKIAEKGDEDWPEIIDSGPEEAMRYLRHEPFLKSIAVAYRYDGNSGISVAFPLLLIKNVEMPVVGGWLVHRIVTNSLGYSILYTPSASRWYDPYVALGALSDADGGGLSDWDFAFETGVKFRFNLANTFMRPITKITTPFWGFRFGITNVGFPNINRLTYVIEVGAGVW